MHIVFLMASLGSGGIGKVCIHLIRELVQRGVRVDLVLGKTKGPFMGLVDDRVSIIPLGSSHPLTGLPGLVRFLAREKPDAVICEKLRVNFEFARPSCQAVGAHALSGFREHSLRPHTQA